MSMGNGEDRGEGRGNWVPFSDGPTKILHPDTAADVLRQLYAEDKARFGRYVAIALTGVAPRGGSRKGDEQ